VRQFVNKRTKEPLFGGNMEEKSHISVGNIVTTIILIIVIVVGGIIYSKYNYNDFTKSVRERGKTSFSRDADVKYSKMKSYKIENTEYNDAMFYENIQVKKNTPYKVTCMVKTENVENENQIYTGGAQIGIVNSLECSKSIIGTSDWTTLTFMFNSKNREEVEIGFRLGGNKEKSKGTAWFSDFKIEEGSLDTDNKWNVACFIIKDIDVNVNLNKVPTNVKLKMSNNDIKDIETNMKRLKNTIKDISKNQVIMDYDIIYINTPLTSISYDEENEYYIDPADVHELIKNDLNKKEYDYIFIGTRLGDLNETKNVLVHDWIGLGGMDYYGIGFSNIRLPDTSNNYVYKYDSQINTFPDEVFVHEFLHTLERNEKEYENTNVANLHDNDIYGYKRENKEGLRKWYAAYMQNTIKNSDGTKAGLTINAYTSKPIHESNFKYSYELNQLKEPQNLIEEINSLINRIRKKVPELLNK